MANLQHLKEEFKACCEELRATARAIGEQEEARLMEKARPLAEAWALYHLGWQREQDAQDVAQDCCIKFLAEIRQEGLPDHTLGHFLLMTKRKVMDLFRRASARRLANLDGGPDEDGEDPLERLPGNRTDPGAELDRSKAVGNLSTVMAALSEEQGGPKTGPVAAILQGLGELCRRLLPVLFTRHFVEGENLKALAKALGLSHDALRQQKKRCLARLRELYTAQFGEPAI
jgi:DNA-directed RNA polymerase specialized sigma24 family protein